MSNEETIGNKIIAEFHGSMIIRPYHSDWNMLMSVVEKIVNIPINETVKPNFWFGYEISNNHCWIWKENAYGNQKEISNFESDSTIKATYTAVIQFITWLNTQQTK